MQGVDKYLEKQFKAMCNKQEQELMQHNLGKSYSQQKQIFDVVNKSYAYQDIEPCY